MAHGNGGGGSRDADEGIVCRSAPILSWIRALTPLQLAAVAITLRSVDTAISNTTTRGDGREDGWNAAASRLGISTRYFQRASGRSVSFESLWRNGRRTSEKAMAQRGRRTICRSNLSAAWNHAAGFPGPGSPLSGSRRSRFSRRLKRSIILREIELPDRTRRRDAKEETCRWTA